MPEQIGIINFNIGLSVKFYFIYFLLSFRKNQQKSV